MVSALVRSCFVLSTLLLCALAADIEDVWTITYKNVRPDGVLKKVPVVNGQFPGPVLRSKPGQSVRIEVRNRLDAESTSIHWHGIKQVGTAWSDGVPGVTQCPIGPGETFVYEFQLDAPGTLWWHSHTGMQKSSLYGALIVDGDKDELPKYDEDRILILNDWYHQKSADIPKKLVAPRPKFALPTFDSLLVNGKGMYNCSKDASKDCDPSHPDAGPFMLDVQPGKSYRLHIIGAASDHFLNFGIEKHVMRVLETETSLLRPYNARFIEANAGQTYSVLLKTKTSAQLRRVENNNGLFWMHVNTVPFSEELSSFAILRYSTAKKGAVRPARDIPVYKIKNWPNWSLKQARRQRAKSIVRMPKKASRTITVVCTINFQPDGRVVWGINNITYVDAGAPLMHAVKMNIKKETNHFMQQTSIPTPFNYSRTFVQNNMTAVAKTGTQVIKVKKDEVVDFLFQNAIIFSGRKLAHPWYVILYR